MEMNGCEQPSGLVTCKDSVNFRQTLLNQRTLTDEMSAYCIRNDDGKRNMMKFDPKRHVAAGLGCESAPNLTSAHSSVSGLSPVLCAGVKEIVAACARSLVRIDTLCCSGNLPHSLWASCSCEA